MYSYLLALMMVVSPLSKGGNHGNHFGWRNQSSSVPPPPSVTLVSHPGASSPGPNRNAPTGDPNPGPFTFGNE